MTRGEILVVRITRLIWKLELVSHAPAANISPEPAAVGGPRGGNRPPGGVDVRDDLAAEFHLKSAEHFKRRLARARSVRALELIEADAIAAVKAWQRTPVVSRPLPGTPFFRRWVIDQLLAGEPVGQIARLGGCSHQYVSRIRVEEGLR